VNHWFRNRKTSATGGVSLGTPIGGVLFPPVLNIFFYKCSWRTSALTLVATTTTFLVLENLSIETNLEALSVNGAMKDRTGFSEIPAKLGSSFG
jgi:hypothetical protein